jgi:hypothetical protein
MVVFVVFPFFSTVSFPGNVPDSRMEYEGRRQRRLPALLIPVPLSHGQWETAGTVPYPATCGIRCVMNPEERMLVAILDDTIHMETPHGRAIKRIVTGLEEYGITVAGIASPADAKAAYSNMPEVDCFLINWNLGGDTAEKHKETTGIIHEIRKRNEDIPIFLMGEPTTAPPSSLPGASPRQRNGTGRNSSPRSSRNWSGSPGTLSTRGTPRAMPGV